MKNMQMITVAILVAALLSITIFMKENDTSNKKLGSGCRPGVAASQAEIRGLPI